MHRICDWLKKTRATFFNQSVVRKTEKTTGFYAYFRARISIYARGLIEVCFSFISAQFRVKSFPAVT